MLLLLANLLVNLFNFDFDVAKKWARRIFIGVIALVVLLVVVFAFRSCNKPTVKLNEAEIQKINEAIETRNREAMEKVLIEVEVKQKEIDANVANGRAETVRAIDEAKKKVKEMSNDELAAYLESLK